MINNYKQIKELLDFRSDDDFYFIQILQRKKDHKIGKVNSTNNNSRLVKGYYIKSLEHFEFVMPEIIQLCEIFQARAGINLNRRSFKKMQLKHISKLVLQLVDGTHNKAHKAYNSVVGLHNDDIDKKWILDIDGEVNDKLYNLIKDFTYEVNPNKGNHNIICRIPSKNGEHIITSPFDIRDFHEHFPNIEIHKNNPTNLYIP